MVCYNIHASQHTVSHSCTLSMHLKVKRLFLSLLYKIPTCFANNFICC